jgi:hypothetical protein
MVKRADSERRVLPELQKARSWRSGPSLISADALSTPIGTSWPRSRPVIGEPRPASPRGFHRVYADRAARSHRVHLDEEILLRGAARVQTIRPQLNV